MALFAAVAPPAAAQRGGGPTVPPPLLPPQQFVGITAGEDHTCVISNYGFVYCWGGNDGNPKDPGRNSVPYFKTTAAQVEAGALHTCVLDYSGAASCWGDNSWGALGNGDVVARSSPTPVRGGLVFSSISAGQWSTCGHTAAGIHCWGAIAGGQAAPVLSVPTTALKGVSIGYRNACAVGGGGRTGTVAECWGDNSYGQLGVPGFGNNLAPTVRASFDPGVLRISAQTYYTCADVAGGRVQCVGANNKGQLGNGSTSQSDQAQTVGGAADLSRVTTGAQHACALDGAGQAYCWGDGLHGEVGNARQDVFSTAQPVIQGEYGITTYRAIAAGRRHTCAIGTDNHIYCWGDNSYGQLGAGKKFNGGPWLVWSPVRTVDPS